MPDSLRPQNSPGQNTGVGSLSLPQGSSKPRDQTQVSHTAGSLYQLSYKGSPKSPQVITNLSKVITLLMLVCVCVCVCVCACMCSVTLHLAFCDPMGCCYIHEIVQARIHEMVAIFYSRLSSLPKD